MALRCFRLKLESDTMKSMCVFRGARGAMFPLIAFVAQANAEAECPSLLTLTRQSRQDWIPFQDGHCGQQSLGMFQTERKKVKDNALKFLPNEGETISLSALSFQGYFYTVTEGQPVDPNCFTITDSTALHFKAGRHGSTGVSDLFMNGNSETTVTATGPYVYDHTPKELNFAFEGVVTFEFSDANSGAVLSQSEYLRIAQGKKGDRNNWWIGHDQCTGARGLGLLCGSLFFNNWGDDDEFLVFYLKREFHDVSCLKDNGDPSITSPPKASQMRFAPLKLQEGGYSIVSFSFQPSWYAVSDGEPVPTDCLQINQDGLTFTAGHSSSQEVGVAFMEGLSKETVMGRTQSGDSTPDELDWALEGTATFLFKRSGESFRSSFVLRLGQFYSNWLGNSACQRTNDYRHRGLLCGDLFFAFDPDDLQNRTTPFRVAPWRWIQ